MHVSKQLQGQSKLLQKTQLWISSLLRWPSKLYIFSHYNSIYKSYFQIWNRMIDHPWEIAYPCPRRSFPLQNLKLIIIHFCKCPKFNNLTSKLLFLPWYHKMSCCVGYAGSCARRATAYIRDSTRIVSSWSFCSSTWICHYQTSALHQVTHCWCERSQMIQFKYRTFKLDALYFPPVHWATMSPFLDMLINNIPRLPN